MSAIKLYPFQQQIIDQSKPKYMFAMDTGTGKTLTSLHHYLKFGQGKHLTVICPPAKYHEGGWDREIKKVEETYGITIPHTIERSSMLSKHWELYKGDFIIVDECHQFKNPTSQRGKALQKLLNTAPGFSLLSATPASNGWGDTINYFIIFGFTKNKTRFNREFGIWEQNFFGNRAVNQVVDYKHQDKLMQWYQSFSVTVKKDEVLDLPPLTNEYITFKPSKEYQEILTERMLDDRIFDSAPALMHGLREYANREDKLDYLKMLCEGTTDNIVVFYQYDSERVAILDMLKDKTIYQVNGKSHSLPDDWEGLKDTVTLIQYSAGSAGIELQYANIVVYYTPTYSYQDFQQSMGRVYRNGQERKVTVYRFVTTETVEASVWHALYDKKDFDEKLYINTQLGGNACHLD